MDNKIDIPIQLATMHDIPIIVTHHHKMFEEMWILKGSDIDTHQFEAMDEALTKKLKEELVNGKCKAWVIRNGDEIVASGAMSINSRTPIPNDPSCEVAYLHSIFTVSNYRKRGFAELITKTAIQYCKSKGIKRITLGMDNGTLKQH